MPKHVEIADALLNGRLLAHCLTAAIGNQQNGSGLPVTGTRPGRDTRRVAVRGRGPIRAITKM
jgi:hypothetical protein